MSRLKIAGIVILGIIVLTIITHSAATIILGHRLKAELAAIKAKGEPVSCAEFGLPKVPDEVNAAVIYAKAFEIMETKRGEKAPDYTDLLQPGSLENNPQVWTDARHYIAEKQNVIPLIDNALSRPRCQFPVNWGAGSGAIFPHYGKLRNLSRLLAMNAIVQAQDGDMDGAVHSIEMGLRISESIGNEPIMLGQLIRIAMIATTTRSLRYVLQCGDISEAQAEGLYKALGSIDMSTSFERAMLGERAFGNWAFEYAARRRDFVGMFGNHTMSLDSMFAMVFSSHIGKPLRYADQLWYLNRMDEIISTDRMQRETGRYPTYQGFQSANIVSTDDPPRWYVISSIFSPVFTNARKKIDAASAELSGSQITLALRVYKNRYGAYPQTLDELRAKLRWEIPQDIFSDKDFIYKRQGDGFLLYSIGDNLKDDKAKPLIIESGTPSKAREGYNYKNMQGQKVADIVWEFER